MALQGMCQTAVDETAVVKLHGLRGPPRHTRKPTLLIPDMG